jgi:hypothetical protein
LISINFRLGSRQPALGSDVVPASSPALLNRRLETSEKVVVGQQEWRSRRGLPTPRLAEKQWVLNR